MRKDVTEWDRIYWTRAWNYESFERGKGFYLFKEVL